MDWQPIETAPLRQWVKLKHPDWDESTSLVGIKRAKSYWWEVKLDGAQWTLRGYDPTHWRWAPLNEPDKETIRP